jgi:hypothetical protein
MTATATNRLRSVPNQFGSLSFGAFEFVSGFVLRISNLARARSG